MERNVDQRPYRIDPVQLRQRGRMLDLIEETRACLRHDLRAAYWLTLEESASLLRMMGGMASAW